MAKTHYSIDGNHIIANIAKLTEKELEIVKKYKALGYILVEEKKEKKPVNEAFKKDVIQNWLKENATKAQWAEYEKLYNAQAKKKDGTLAFMKDGITPKISGHVGTLSWFKKEFPNYPEAK